ncbi:hypothetical protein Aduo_008416 [Ancylostoma duodenale]
MSRLCAIAFLKAESVDSVSVKDVDGSPVVGKHSKHDGMFFFFDMELPSEGDTAFPQRVFKLLDELIVRIGQIDRRMATKDLQLGQQVDVQWLTGGMNEVRVIGRELLKRIPQSVDRGDEIQYMHARRRDELFLQVEGRMGTVEKVGFIKRIECKSVEICGNRFERSDPKTDEILQRRPQDTVKAAFYRVIYVNITVFIR